MTGAQHAEVSMETTHIDWCGNEGVTVNPEVVQVPVEPTDESKLLGSTEGVAIGPISVVAFVFAGSAICRLHQGFAARR